MAERHRDGYLATTNRGKGKTQEPYKYPRQCFLGGHPDLGFSHPKYTAVTFLFSSFWSSVFPDLSFCCSC